MHIYVVMMTKGRNINASVNSSFGVGFVRKQELPWYAFYGYFFILYIICVLMSY